MAPAPRDPLFRCGDRGLLARFLHRYQVDADAPRESVIDQCARAFARIPYENLTKIIKADSVVGPASALRLPDEVLADHLKWGTGGTCFSLTAALLAVFDALGVEAQPLLADRSYGEGTHCALVVRHRGQALLLDPGFLLYTPTPLPDAAIAVADLGYAAVELRPVEGGNRIELATEIRGVRKVRLTYRRSPVDAAAFRRAWTDSFTWEMMTYPVLTRAASGRHLYLQGASAMVRTSERTVRSQLEAPAQIDFIGRHMGIARAVVLRAWEVMHHGTA